MMPFQNYNAGEKVYYCGYLPFYLFLGSKCQYPRVVTLWVEPQAPGDVVLPLELGLGLSHLLLDPVQEEGVHETLGVAFALGQPEVL